MNTINKILKSGFCLGCGMCETVCTSQRCSMILENGFYVPQFKSQITKNDIETICRVCPGIHIESKEKIKDVWGNIIAIKEAWSADNGIRKKASSGGIISTLAIYLLETRQIDAVLQVGVSDSSYLYNELKISHTREEVLNNVGSRYAPALVFNKLKEVLDSSDEIFALIGKPCDIAAVKNFIAVFPQYTERFDFFLAIFCAGIPNYTATQKVIELSGHDEEPYFLKYRGDGWPGFFEAKYKDGRNFKMSYNDSWGNILGKQLGFRCKICPDGIGLLADVAVGDSWNTKNGYPDFEESDGRSFVMLRTRKGLDLFNGALQHQMIVANDLDINKIAEMQAYQYQRRLLAGWRILPIRMLVRMLNFRNLGIYTLLWAAPKKTGIKNMLGTIKRFVKIKPH